MPFLNSNQTRSLFGINALLGILASGAALWFQRTSFDPLDRIMLPGLGLLWVVLWLLIMLRRLRIGEAQYLIYCAYAFYFLLALNHQFKVFAPQYHMLSQNTYWFAPLYASAFLFFRPREAQRLSVGIFTLSLIIVMANFAFNPGLLGDGPLLASTAQFLLVGVAMTVLQTMMGQRHAAMLATQVAAYQDALTGASNRRAAEEHLLQLDEQQASFTLALLDLDYFKSVNDEHGHAAGDQVLCAVVSEMQRAVPGSAMVARWGGEEFLLILPALPQAEVSRLLERLQGRLQSRVIGPVTGITASIGVSQRRPGETPTSVLARADNALYDAKDLGRNRVVYAEASPAPLPPLPHLYPPLPVAPVPVAEARTYSDAAPSK